MEQLASHLQNFQVLSIFWVSVEKIYVALQSDKNNDCFTCKPTHIFLSYLTHSFTEWKMFQTKVIEKIRTHILCSMTSFKKSCHLWDSVEKYYCTRHTRQYGAYTKHIGCLRLHTEYIIFTAFLQHKHDSLIHYTYNVLFYTIPYSLANKHDKLWVRWPG